MAILIVAAFPSRLSRYMLKSNTSKTRTHSLFRQGCMLYELIPNMPEHRLIPLMQAFARAIGTASEFNGFYGNAK